MINKNISNWELAE